MLAFLPRPSLTALLLSHTRTRPVTLSNGTNSNDLEWLWRSLLPLISFELLGKYSTWTEQRTWPVILTVLVKLKDFSRSHAVTYMVKVVISRKRCKLQTLLLQITNRKWHMTCRIAAILMTLSDLQGHAPNASLLKCESSYTVVQKRRHDLFILFILTLHIAHSLQ